MRHMHLLSSAVGTFVLIGLNCALGQSAAPIQQSAPFLNGIEVRFNGREPLTFGLDTGGAADFFIVPEKASELGLTVVGRRSIRTSDRQSQGEASSDMVKANSLAVAGHLFVAPEGIVMPDSRRSGTLGITLFRDVLLTLDYPHDRLTITSGELRRDDRDVIAYTTQSDASFRPLRFSPTVKITLAGRSIPALIDTGARKLNADLIVPKDIAATLPLGAKESETVVQDAAGRSFPSYTARLRGELTLGNVVIQEPTILVSDWLGFVDLARVCNRLAITIDQRNRLLRLNTPAMRPTVN